MEKKKTDVLTAVQITVNTSLKTLLTDIDNKHQKLVDDAIKNGLELSGPQIWIYRGADGKPETPFQLDICQPVNESTEKKEGAQLVSIPAINCVSTIHKGPWADLGSTYCSLFKDMQQESVIPTGISREVYLHCDFEDQTNNVTEVQIEIKKL